MMSLPAAMPLTEMPEEPLVYLVQTRHLAFPEDGDMEESQALWKEFHTNITHKNPLLKAFYPHRHLWGADGRDVLNVFAFENMDDAHRYFDEQMKLVEAHWPDIEARKAFFSKYNKYFTPWHSDRFFENVPELHKLRHVALEAED